ncbi:MAG: polysaccharide biosynthesis tyrosine autokinase [Candidatus Omnitrophica bacterium]|nr:polysaccharide biosynthesis tyrosine autokinase [Candidatus Omnitrophota bacterium]
MDNFNGSIPPESGSVEENINLRQYWHVILERRWLVITAFVSVFILCLIYLAKAPRIYQATATLQINPESQNVLNLRDVFSVEGREQDYLQTQYKKLQARTLIASVVSKLKLDKDPRYEKALDKIDAVAGDITISPVRLSRLVNIKVEHTNPKQAAAIANELMNRFIEDNIDQKRNGSMKALEGLKVEEASQKAKVETAEQALQKYKENLRNISLEENQNIILQSLKQANEQVMLAKSEATIAQRLNLEVKTLIKNGARVDTIPQVAEDKLIQELKAQLAIQEAELDGMRQRYKNGWPTVKEKLQEINSIKKSIDEGAQRIIETIENEAQIAKSKEQSIQSLVDKLTQEQMDLGKQSIQYEALKLDAELQKILFNKVSTSEKELAISINNMLNNLQIVDAAVEPITPVKPRVLLTLILGLFGGLGVACGLAFFVNYLDDSIKTQDDIEIYLHLPFLGYVPNIKSNSVIERDLQAHIHPQSTAAEGFRTIRAAVSLMPKADKYRLLVVTSTIPSEGKSLLASNLAIVTAQTGLKTLLVDADLRRPSVHKVFQFQGPIGLSSFLNETTANLKDIIHTTEVPNLDVICAGAIPSNPSELSGSKRMRQLLQEASQRYDRIFLDCPPVSAVSDPLIIASMTDGVLFVTKFNKIRREHARKSLQRIQDAGINILGVVLNDIDFEGKDSYYYSYYYYQNRYYSSHYSNPAKEKTRANNEPAAKS